MNLSTTSLILIFVVLLLLVLLAVVSVGYAQRCAARWNNGVCAESRRRWIIHRVTPGVVRVTDGGRYSITLSRSAYEKLTGRTDLPQHVARCEDLDCRISRGVCDALTFGKGKLCSYGYWELPCEACARWHEVAHPEDGECWPYEDNDMRKLRAEVEKVIPGAFRYRGRVRSAHNFGTAVDLVQPKEQDDENS